MTDLSILRDAFDALEERADAACAAAPAIMDFQPARRPTWALAPVGAAVAVVATAAVVVVWQQSGSNRPTGTPAGASTAAVPPLSSAASTPAATPTATEQFPPSTGAALTEKVREILAGTATIAVTETDVPGGVTLSVPSGPPPSDASPAIVVGSPVKLPSGGGSGPSIVGTLTAGGRTGGFQVVAYQADPGSKAMCDGGTDCSVRALADGTSLAVGSWHDDQVSGGVTYQVEAVRPDGREVLLHLSTERDPKGHSTRIASALPLTVAQMTALVTSDRW
ncbi:MAG: hypothetical protein ABR571_03205 [Jatrophihabitans sp.]|uniref:hypothetical protein n=1 Tax=Jatrophihabitans sp. TaxID=1932789 RepID=UPI003915FDE6